MNFTSQICTSKKQSERLLALGLKRETADMCWNILTLHGTPVTYPSQDVWLDYSIITDSHFPAWSLHRLIEMLPNKIKVMDSSASLIVSNEKVQYYLHDVEYSDYLTGAGHWKDGNTYDNIIDCIEWLIKEGHFNKEYLEE